MRIKVPIVGTVTEYNPRFAELDGIGISGDPDDPVRVDINLGEVSWSLVSVDLENDVAEIEVEGEQEAMDKAKEIAQKYIKEGRLLKKAGVLEAYQKHKKGHE